MLVPACTVEAIEAAKSGERSGDRSEHKSVGLIRRICDAIIHIDLLFFISPVAPLGIPLDATKYKLLAVSELETDPVEE